MGSQAATDPEGILYPRGHNDCDGKVKRETILRRMIGILLILAVRGETAEVEARLAAPGGDYTNVTAAELKRMLEAKDFFFVNVHIPYQGDMAGTDALEGAKSCDAHDA